MNSWAGKILESLALAAIISFKAGATTCYVNLSNPTPAAPFTDWSIAATNIQNAIDASSDGDLILVTNGVYATGGRVVYGSLTNRVAVNKAVRVQSVNGPSVTSIEGNSVLGNSAIRCIYLVSGSFLSGFTITNGGTMMGGDALLDASGGGIWTTNNSTAVISNCILTGNAAYFYGGGAYYGNLIGCSITKNTSSGSGGGVAYSQITNSSLSANLAHGNGGGAFMATLGNCKIINNAASFDGGGAGSSSLYGCLVVSNAASGIGGGISSSVSVANCTILGNNSTQGGGGVNGGPAVFNNNIVYFNTVSIGSTPNYSGLTSAKNCCTFPMPSGSPVVFTDNITNEPSFVDYAGGNYRLLNNTPCVNSGKGTASTAGDLDGNPRLVDGFLDIGAYENQTASNLLPYQFALRYGLTANGSVDTDGDGLNNWQEAIAETIPTNSASLLKILSISNNIAGTTVKWQSVSNKKYNLQRSTNLVTGQGFVPIYTNPALPQTSLTYTDTKATNAGPYFYRVGVQ